MKTRRNRFDPEDETHLAVRAEPARWTRQSRRAAGLRVSPHVEAMRAHNAAYVTLPRAIRRLMRDPNKATKRLAIKKAKVNRLLAPYGVYL